MSSRKYKISCGSDAPDIETEALIANLVSNELSSEIMCSLKTACAQRNVSVRIDLLHYDCDDDGNNDRQLQVRVDVSQQADDGFASEALLAFRPLSPYCS